MNILNQVFENGDEKVVIFSQWERMARLVAAELDKLGIPPDARNGRRRRDGCGTVNLPRRIVL